MKTLSLRLFRMSMLFLSSLILLSLKGLSDRTYANPSTTQWEVFSPMEITSANLLANPGFEEGTQDNADNWGPYESGYIIASNGGRIGGRALELTNTGSGKHGALQVIDLNQTEPRPLYFSGWSNAENITGHSDSNYSIYIDLQYKDDTWLYSQVLQFDTYSHDWQFREGFIMPAKPIWKIYVYCLLRATHQGTAWFDDLSVQEAQWDILFDSLPIKTSKPSPLPYGGEPLLLETAESLGLTLAAEGGAILGVKLGDANVVDPNSSYASGFFIRDVAKKSDFIHVGGSLTQEDNRITHTSNMAELNINFDAKYTATFDGIEIYAEVTNTSQSERAITLYFALPINATEEWIWGDDIRTSKTITGKNEFANSSSLHNGIGATGYISKYPWACLSGPDGGIAMGVPLDTPCAMRLIYNPVTNQFYAAFDLGLSPKTTKAPNTAWVNLVLYSFDNKWGFRAASQGYYELFPNAFRRRIPAIKEGIWVAFSDLSTIDNLADFGIAFHELGSLNQAPFDCENNILPFYYVSEPQTHWLPVNDSAVDTSDYNQIIAYLKGQYGKPNMLKNDRFEEGAPESADYWSTYGSGYMIDTDGGRDGGRALKLTNTEGDMHGASQVIELNQTKPRPLYFGGWSKAENVTGEPDSNYSVYLDVCYTDGNWSYMHVLEFDTGTHDWQFLEDFIIPEKPIQSVYAYCLLRLGHSGTAWFDGLNVHDLILSPNQLTNAGFEDSLAGISWECNDSGCIVDETVTRSGTRSLKLINDPPSDDQTCLQTITINQKQPRPLYFSGWSKAENVTGEPDINYSVYLDLCYTDGNWSYMHVLEFDTGTHDWQFLEDFIIPEKPIQSVNVHCLLRLSHSGTVWFDSLSVQEVYPSLPNQLTNAGFEDSPAGIYWECNGSGCIVDETVARSGTHSLKLINDAHFDAQICLQTISINQTEPQPLYFSGWSKAENVTGEMDSNYSVYLDVYYTDDSALYRQVLEFDTGTHDWQFLENFIIPEKPIQSVNVHCLLRLSHSGTVWFDDLSVQAVGGDYKRAEATLSSGSFDECGRYRYWAYGADEFPWCNGRVGCNLFIVNPDPDIIDPDYLLNKAQLDWNEALKKLIMSEICPDGGVYIDSFLRDSTVMNFRIAHFDDTDIPLTYRTSDLRVGVPEVFATTEFARWLAQQVHNEMGLNMMANWILRDLPWGADLFDVVGTETNWLSNGHFVPESDATLSYRRTLSFKRPYCLLMNTNFYNFTHEMVERYFQICLFYGIYPSMFSQNAAEDPYWEDPNLYNRDRDLFKRYIPLLRRLNKAGWQPVTYTITSDPNVYIERFGNWPDLHFTLRNTSDTTFTVEITLQADELGLPACPLISHAMLSETLYPVSDPGPNRTVAVTLSPLASEVVQIKEIKEVNVCLSSGLNIFCYPVKALQGYTSYDLIVALGGKDEISKIERYDPNTKNYETTIYDPNGVICGKEFNIVSGEGYLVYMKVAKLIPFAGPIMNPTISCEKGLNIISIPTIPDGYTSYKLLSYMGSPDEIISIQRFNTEKGIFETTAYYYGIPSGIEFNIIKGDAYLIYMKAAKYKDAPQ